VHLVIAHELVTILVLRSRHAQITPHGPVEHGSRSPSDCDHSLRRTPVMTVLRGPVRIPTMIDSKDNDFVGLVVDAVQNALRAWAGGLSSGKPTPPTRAATSFAASTPSAAFGGDLEGAVPADAPHPRISTWPTKSILMGRVGYG
jgi:hypothetical protein